MMVKRPGCSWAVWGSVLRPRGIVITSLGSVSFFRMGTIMTITVSASWSSEDSNNQRKVLITMSGKHSTSNLLKYQTRKCHVWLDGWPGKASLRI